MYSRNNIWWLSDLKEPWIITLFSFNCLFIFVISHSYLYYKITKAPWELLPFIFQLKTSSPHLHFIVQNVTWSQHETLVPIATNEIFCNIFYWKCAQYCHWNMAKIMQISMQFSQRKCKKNMDSAFYIRVRWLRF